MPVIAIPIAIQAALGALAAYGAAEVSRPVIERMFRGHKKELEEWALSKAFEAMGVPIDPANGFSRESITAAINAGPLAGTGIELSDIFDPEAIKRDVKRIALEKAVADTGLPIAGLTVADLKASLRAYVSDVTREQLESGDGDIIAAAPALVEMLQMIRAANKSDPAGPGATPGYQPGPSQPVDMTPHGIANRERQARYRANHQRHWEAA